MKIVGRTFNCSKAAENEAPPFDEEIFEAGGSTSQDFEKMTVDALKKYAEEKKIDLGGARVKADIIAIISAADIPQLE